jgi:hypothetical protein
MVQKIHACLCDGTDIGSSRLLKEVTFSNFLRVNGIEKSGIRWTWR